MVGPTRRIQTVLRYGLAVVFVAMAWLLKLSVAEAFTHGTPFLLFPLAVVGSAFLGFGPSVVASVLSTLLTAIYFTPEADYVPGLAGFTAARLLAELLQLVGISFLAYLILRAKRAAEAQRLIAVSAQQALRHRVEELETLLNVLPVATFTALDPGCQRMMGNRAGCRLMRQKPGGNLSMSPMAPDRPRGVRFVRGGQELSADELPVQFAASQTADVIGAELDMVTEDGTVVHLLGNAAPLFDEAGHVRGAIGAFTDVTAMKRIEAELARSRLMFKRIAETTPDVLYVYDLTQHRVVYANREMWQALGYGPEELSEPGFGESLIHPEDFAAAGMGGAAEDMPEGHVRERQYRVRRKDGTWRWIRSRDTVFSRDASGRPEQILGIAQDVTDRVAAQEGLREKAVEAERANRAKDDFLAALSHELRTPLTPVMMTVDALRNEPGLPPGVGAELEMIQRNVGLEARLIDDLLDLTRVARGKIELQLGDVDVHGVLEQAMQTSTDDSGQVKAVNVERALGARHPHVRGDASRLMQVFWNVLRNALKFTPDGGRVTVRTYNEPAAGADGVGLDVRRLVIEISGTGIGIAPERLPRLFTAFEQGDPSITRQFGGLGLGLAIAKAILELHGGSIAAESEGVGHGATFRMALPAIEPAAAATEPQGTAPLAATATEAVAQEPAVANGRRLRVLLVEDDPTTLLTMARLLRRQFEVVTATDVRSAKQVADEHELDLLVSDLGLPDGSGIEVMQYVRDHGAAPGIALSGYGMEEDVKRSLAAGFSEHLTKPVNLDRLKAAMDRVGRSEIAGGGGATAAATTA